MVKQNDPCNGGAALFLLKNERYDTDKKALLTEIITECAKKQCKVDKQPNSKKTGKKRKMSWYNACIKINGKEAMASGECKKVNLNDSDIKKYQQKADEFNNV